MAEEDADLALLLHDAGKLVDVPANVRVVEGDVLDRAQVDPAVRGQNVVSNLDAARTSPRRTLTGAVPLNLRPAGSDVALPQQVVEPFGHVLVDLVGDVHVALLHGGG